LLLKAFEISDSGQKETLMNLLTETDLDLKISSVRNLFNELGVREACKERMNHHYSIAKEAIHKTSLSEKQKLPLLQLAAYLMEREI
jgi:geranylgeranyl diphosphate synthase type II